MDVAERVQNYKDRANQARIEARRMTSAAAKEGLLKVAQEWDELAEDILKKYSPPK